MRMSWLEPQQGNTLEVWDSALNMGCMFCNHQLVYVVVVVVVVRDSSHFALVVASNVFSCGVNLLEVVLHRALTLVAFVSVMVLADCLWLLQTACICTMPNHVP